LIRSSTGRGAKYAKPALPAGETSASSGVSGEERDEEALVPERNGSLLQARGFFITLLA
jgi:hypothetical protein